LSDEADPSAVGGGGWSIQPAGGGTTTRRARADGPPPGASAGGQRDEVVGQARGIADHQRGAEIVWTFRVERYDAAGNRELLAPVEMRGYRFEGAIADGDWVRVRGPVKRGTLRASQVENLSTGALIRPTTNRAFGVVVGVLFLALTIGVLAIIAFEVVKYG
jgi:hypothetical protein